MVLTGLGVALRLALLLAAGGIELQSDEGNYVYLALMWEHFGTYQDGYRFLWPPGLPWLLKLALGALGTQGLTAVKLLGVAASASIGMTTMLFARRVFGERAARVAGLIWIFYLPLAAYTHQLWPEPIFLGLYLPALYLILTVLEEPEARDAPVTGRVGLAGLLFAAALYMKEAPLYLLPVLALLLFALAADRREGLRRASLLLLAAAVAVAPWTLRNLEVYGRVIPMASTLGENLHAGVNARYKNYDVQALGKRPHGKGGQLEGVVGRTWFTELDAEPWERADELPVTPERLRENVRRGLSFALEHPGWLVRSRIKKLADLVAPTSFFVRHQAMGKYDELPLGRVPRMPLTIWAVVCPLLVLPLGLIGYFLALHGGPRDRAARWLFGAVLAYVVATGLLVAMSRFRLPAEPFLIVLTAGLLSGRAGRGAEAAARPGAARVAGAVLGCGLLAFLWWVDWPELSALIQLASEGAA